MKIIIIILLLVLVIYLSYKLIKIKENFNIESSYIKDIETNKLIYRIIPSITDFTSLIDPQIIQNNFSNYLGVHIPGVNNINNIDNNIIYTRALNSNNWYGPLQNHKPDKDYIIIQLTFSNDKKMMGIGYTIKNNKPIYKPFIKETTDILSNWKPLEQSDSIYNDKISYILFDIFSNKLIGINHEDGQIYMKETSDLNSIWVGPINYDTPMKAIYYYKNNFMIGIGKEDNYLYIKDGDDWTQQKWDNTNINRTYVYDVIFDRDGCLIATSPKGLLKQPTSNFFSQFVRIDSINNKLNETMKFDEIMLYKTGCKFFNKDKNKISSDYVKNILDKKRKTLKTCKKIKFNDNTLIDETEDIISDNFKLSSSLNFLLNDISFKI